VARTKKHEAIQRQRADEDALKTFQTLMGRASDRREKMCGKFRDRKKAYDGVMPEIDRARWQTPVAPLYAKHSIEVLIANLLERNVGKLLPHGPEDVDTTKCIEAALYKWRELDEREEADDTFVRELTVMGAAWQLVLWAYEVQEIETTRWVADAAGHYTPETTKQDEILSDRPTATNVSVYDAFYDPSASRRKEIGWFVDRAWVPFETLKRYERRDMPDGSRYGIYRDLALVAESSSEVVAAESKKLTGRDHGDAVEVCRLWTPNEVLYVANRTVVIGRDPFPFHHREIPAVVAHTVKDLYTLEGLSIAELIMPLQTAAWEVLNSLIQNTRIASLLLAKKRRDADIDDDALEAATGDVIEVEQQDDLEFWHPSSSVLDAGMTMLGVLKTTMQETSGANAYLAGGASETIDQTTATGISIVQSMAQKLLQSWQRSVRRAFKRAGRMEVKLAQQYMRRAETVRLSGEDGYDHWELMPWEIRGEYDWSYQAVDESLNEQQKRGEARLLFQDLLAVAGHPALVQEGSMVMLRQAIEDLLEAHGRLDVENYIGEAPLMPMLPPGTPGADPGAALGGPPAAGTPPGAAAGGPTPLRAVG
jgi:hypothetical protein